MLKIKKSIHIFLTCLAALLCTQIAYAKCCPQKNSAKNDTYNECCTQQTNKTASVISPCRPAAAAPCYVVGGNSEICSSEPAMRIKVDEWRVSDQCYVEYGICERNEMGQCGWRSTNALMQCIADMEGQMQESVEPCGGAIKNFSPVAALPPK